MKFIKNTSQASCINNINSLKLLTSLRDLKNLNFFKTNLQSHYDVNQNL